MESYLQQYHSDEIREVLSEPDASAHVSVRVDLAHLERHEPALLARLLQSPTVEMLRWDACLRSAQASLRLSDVRLPASMAMKQNCHTRFVNLPGKREAFPDTENLNEFVQVQGCVIRISPSRCYEYRRRYKCTRCRREVLIEADYCYLYMCNKPGPCRAASCGGSLQVVSSKPLQENCRAAQEIRITEFMSTRRVPASLTVTLEDDLVDACCPGDHVTVVGVIEQRSKPPVAGKRTAVTIALRANSLVCDGIKDRWAKDKLEHQVCAEAAWDDAVSAVGALAARDFVIESIAPHIKGMHPVKLSVALALASCAEINGDSREELSATTVRKQAHLLLIGDPGVSKSHLLQFASDIASPAVYTNGMGCSAAGLTAAAVKGEDGQWELEAGALALADTGVCCIDEFLLMSKPEQASLHEAMEQQSVSVAKAGMVRQLSTRCVVLAAANPKKNISAGQATSAANIGLGGPLLSRFDIVFILRDIRTHDWDDYLATQLLAAAVLDAEKALFHCSSLTAHWELRKLQMHFSAIKAIEPKVSPEANLILGEYYKACRSDHSRDPARTTPRLLDSLYRLAKGHARLLFRREVTSIDALTIIQLMEASWGFGRIVPSSYELIKSELPLGPDQAFIDRLLDKLQLHQPSIRESAIVQPTDPDLVTRFHEATIAEQQAEKAKKPAWQATPMQQLPCASTRPGSAGELAASTSAAPQLSASKHGGEGVSVAKKRRQLSPETTLPEGPISAGAEGSGAAERAADTHVPPETAPFVIMRPPLMLHGRKSSTQPKGPTSAVGEGSGAAERAAETHVPPETVSQMPPGPPLMLSNTTPDTLNPSPVLEIVTADSARNADAELASLLADDDDDAILQLPMGESARNADAELASLLADDDDDAILQLPMGESARNADAELASLLADDDDDAILQLPVGESARNADAELASLLADDDDDAILQLPMGESARNADAELASLFSEGEDEELAQIEM